MKFLIILFLLVFVNGEIAAKTRYDWCIESCKTISDDASNSRFLKTKIKKNVHIIQCKIKCRVLAPKESK